MRTKSMLLSIPFTRWLVKDKNVNENKDSLEVVMKKEEYVKYIEELQADPKHFEDLAEKNYLNGTNTINNVTKSSNYLAKNQLNGLTDLVVSKLENNASDIKISAEHISSVIKETLASVNSFSNNFTFRTILLYCLLSF